VAKEDHLETNIVQSLEEAVSFVRSQQTLQAEWITNRNKYLEKRKGFLDL
jgi:hypothetical protein